MTNKEYLIALSAFPPFGQARIKLLLSYFGDARKIWKLKSNDLEKLGLKTETISKFLLFRNNFDFSDYFNRLKRLSIKCLTFDEEGYPQNLKEISDAPQVLYLKGELTFSDTNAVAIVGSRKMTSYGREVTKKFAGELASLGVTIVSGLARGIDTQAHWSALEVKGRTIGVLGCGLDNLYPPENTLLAEKIVNGSGAIISEYSLGVPARPTNFAARNRIISGISKAIVVVEGAAKSGTLLTASHAGEQGKMVFAVPGQIYSPLSAAPHFLLKNGASLALAAKDILDELGIQIKVDREKMEKIAPSSKREEILLSILENEDLHLDEIARISSLEVAEVSARLTIMELKGLVKNMGGGVYKRQ